MLILIILKRIILHNTHYQWIIFSCFCFPFDESISTNDDRHPYVVFVCSCIFFYWKYFCFTYPSLNYLLTSVHISHLCSQPYHPRRTFFYISSENIINKCGWYIVTVGRYEENNRTSYRNCHLLTEVQVKLSEKF